MFQLGDGHARFQSQCDLRPRLGMRHIPAFRLAPWLIYAASLLVIGMNLHRKFFMREEKLQQQREAPRIAGGVAHKLSLVFLADLRQRLPGERSVGHFAIVAGEPGFANFFARTADWDKSATDRASPTGADRIAGSINNGYRLPMRNYLDEKGRSRTNGLSRT